MKRISPSIYPFWKQTTAKRKPVDNPFKRKYQKPFETWAMESFLSNDYNQNRNQNRNQNKSFIDSVVEGVAAIPKAAYDAASALGKLAKEKIFPQNKSAKPVSAKPESAKPVSAKPESAKPVSAKPVSAKPESAKPESAKPELLVEPGDSANLEIISHDPVVPAFNALWLQNANVFFPGGKPLQLPHNVGLPLTPLNFAHRFSHKEFNPNLRLLNYYRNLNKPPSLSEEANSQDSDIIDNRQPKAVPDVISDTPPKSEVIISSDPDHIINDENIHMPQTKQEIAQFRKHLDEFKKEYGEIMRNEMIKQRATHLAERTSLYNKYNSLMQMFDAMERAEDPQYADLLSRKDEIDYYRDVLSSKPPKLLKTLENKYYKILRDSSKIIENPETITEMEKKNKQPIEMLRNIEEVGHQLKELLKFEKRSRGQRIIKSQMGTLSKIYDQLHDTFYRYYFE